MDDMNFYNKHGPPEEWRDIKGYEGLYQVSNLGRVRSLDRLVNNKHGQRFLKGGIKRVFDWGTGYQYVNLHCQQKRKSKSVHRLVAEAFVENVYNKPEVNHIDGNKHNNRADNLEWCTSSENELHAYNLGLIKLPNTISACVTNTETGVKTFFDSLSAASRFVGAKRDTFASVTFKSGLDKAVFGKYVIERTSA